MGFGSMVSFMVKWTIASIPALIILTVVIYAIIMLFAALMNTFDVWRWLAT